MRCTNLSLCLDLNRCLVGCSEDEHGFFFLWSILNVFCSVVCEFHWTQFDNNNCFQILLFNLEKSQISAYGTTIEEFSFFFNTCIITGHFFRYTTFCLICGTDSKRCWKRPSAILVHIAMTASQLVQICRLHVHDVDLLFHLIPGMLYWFEIWWFDWGH